MQEESQRGRLPANPPSRYMTYRFNIMRDMTVAPDQFDIVHSVLDTQYMNGEVGHGHAAFDP